MTLVNIRTDQGTINSAEERWHSAEIPRTWAPVVGTVFSTSRKCGKGGLWQLRGPSRWVDGAFEAESWNDRRYDGIRLEITGKKPVSSSALGWAVAGRAIFVGDGEPDQEVSVWVKVS